MKMFLKILIVGSIITIAWFYFYLRVISEDVSNELPFSEVIGKNLVLDRDVFLIRNNTPEFYKTISTVIDEKESIGQINEETTIVEIIKKGTPLTINKATIQSHGESGTYGQITGILFTKKYNILFKQEWGIQSVYVFDNSEPTGNNTSPFLFKKPIWVTKTEHDIHKTYYLPEL